MILTDTQIDYIATNLEFYGVAQNGLKEDLLDHICTYIEQSTHTGFDEAYKEAIQNFGGHYAMGRLQQQTLLMVVLKKQKLRQKAVYISGFIAAFLMSTGSIFKIMHWPGASMLLLVGFVVLNLIFLPLFFYHRYKRPGNNIAE
ncbi:MAG: hypothetical protein V4581_06120 [Bacteroidota bacterium]